MPSASSAIWDDRAVGNVMAHRRAAPTTRITRRRRRSRNPFRRSNTSSSPMVARTPPICIPNAFGSPLSHAEPRPPGPTTADRTPGCRLPAGTQIAICHASVVKFRAELGASSDPDGSVAALIVRSMSRMTVGAPRDGWCLAPTATPARGLGRGPRPGRSRVRCRRSGEPGCRGLPAGCRRLTRGSSLRGVRSSSRLRRVIRRA